MNIEWGIGGAQPAKGFHGFVMADLGRSIVGGDFPANSILPRDADLLKRYGVSRTVLREALKTLAAKGLIQAKAKIGTRVLSRSNWNLFDPYILKWHAESGAVDAQFLFDLQEMRVALEPEAARLAALRRTDNQVAELFSCVEEMGKPGVTGPDFVDSDLRFHVTVAEASQNPFMRAINVLIEVALEAAFRVSSPIPNTVAHERAITRHRAIAQAIKDGDAAGAQAAMHLVIQEGIDRVAAVTGSKSPQGLTQ
jgi:DNA-binding FadR family transcriptional regulator